MATLICTQFPALGIFIPQTGEWINFSGGRLDIEDDHPYYDIVMTEAARNPAIVVYASVSTCRYCGDVEKSKAKLDEHVKDVHFDKWIADAEAAHGDERIAEVKKRSGFACDVCQPVQEFGTADDLAAHALLIHADKPALNDAGEEVSGGKAKRGKASEVEGVPAATGSQK